MRATATNATCRHCRRHRASRPRGLCWACYYTPGVKDQYEPQNGRGVSKENRLRRPLPTRPTSALPGTPKKLKVLERRAALGRSLWHPLDNRGDDDRVTMRGLFRLTRRAA